MVVHGGIFYSHTIKFNVDAMQFRVILSFSPKLPRTHVEFYCNVNKNTPDTRQPNINCPGKNLATLMKPPEALIFLIITLNLSNY